MHAGVPHQEEACCGSSFCKDALSAALDHPDLLNRTQWEDRSVPAAAASTSASQKAAAADCTTSHAAVACSTRSTRVDEASTAGRGLPRLQHVACALILVNHGAGLSSMHHARLKAAASALPHNDVVSACACHAGMKCVC